MGNFKRKSVSGYLSYLFLLSLLGGSGCVVELNRADQLTTPQEPGSYESAARPAQNICPNGTQFCVNQNWCCPQDAVCVLNTDNALGCGNDYCCLACEEDLPCGLGCCPLGMKCVVNPGQDSPCDTVLCCDEDDIEASCPDSIARQCPDGTTCVVYENATVCSSQYVCLTPTGDIGCPGETLCLNGHDFCPAALACEENLSQTCQVDSTNHNYCCGEVANPASCPAGTENCGDGCCTPGLDCVQNKGNTSGCIENYCCVNYDVDVPSREAEVYDAGTSQTGACPPSQAPRLTVECPNGIDCCPAGTWCAGWGSPAGMCEGSSSGNYCCEAPACDDWKDLCECSARTCYGGQAWYETSTGKTYECTGDGTDCREAFAADCGAYVYSSRGAFACICPADWMTVCDCTYRTCFDGSQYWYEKPTGQKSYFSGTSDTTDALNTFCGLVKDEHGTWECP